MPHGLSEHVDALAAPPAMRQRLRALRVLAGGTSPAEAAQALGVGRSSLYRALERVSRPRLLDAHHTARRPRRPTVHGRSVLSRAA